MFELVLEGLLLLTAFYNVLCLREDQTRERFGIVGIAIAALFLL